MAWLSLTSLRSKLQLFACLLVLVPGAILALLAFPSVQEALERAEGRQLARIGRDSLDELAAALADGRKDLGGWARQDLMRDVIIGDIDKRVSRFLHSLTAAGTPYRDLFCVDRAGQVVSASDPSLLGSPLGGQKAARVALEGRKFLAGPIASGGAGRITIDIAVPIADPDRGDTVVGALVGRYDWRHAMGLVDRIRRSLLTYGLAVDVLVLDRDGAVIGESWRDDLAADVVERLRPAASAIARRLPARARHGFLRSDAADVLVGYDRTEDDSLGWTALVLEPQAEAFAPVRRLQQRLGLVLAVVLLGGLGLATLWAARMSRPLRELTRATQVIARPGAVPALVPVRSRDEIGLLATAFNAMGAALARAQQDLLIAAKFAFVGELAAGIAHEVRTPLGIMRSSAQMLARPLAPGPERTELATMIVGEVDRIDRVVTGLLELARPRAPQMEPTALAPVLARALDFVDGQAREKSITLRRELDERCGLARCDPEQMYQVALNLIVNALQVVPAGGHVTLRTMPRRDGHVGFEVIDDGPGIPPELHERIFAPFFSRREGGTGLGLALVQRMVQAHQGTVTVESAVGHGTTFRVELPAWGEKR